MEWTLIICYSIAMAIICSFSFEQLNLAIIYRKFRKLKTAPVSQITHYPIVTIQLPVFNEKYVVERLIDCVCNIDYPKDKLEIQVLDDSNDETVEISRSCVEKWKTKGIDIQLVLRKNRVGYKAGALAHGMSIAKGEYIAIFDADFMPNPDFLYATIPHFTDKTGMVQTKWGHINENYSLLTKIQAFGLNAHFTVEQTGRASSGKYMNFNGTAGIWRKCCIEEAGGWQHDTLTEDLDLSYRAQVKGWEFKYIEDVVTPAELPVIVTAIKSQQYRWNKGAAETAKKNLRMIFKSKISKTLKLHSSLHLLSSSVFILLLFSGLLSIPMLVIKTKTPETQLAYNLGGIFAMGFLAMGAFYWISVKLNKRETPFKYYAVYFPLFVIFSMGMSLHNAIAVAEGYLGKKTPFIRTPKFDIKGKSDSFKGNIYLSKSFTPTTILEGLLSIYFAFGVGYGILHSEYGLIFFHLMLTLGFGAVFMYSIGQVANE